MVTIYSRHRFGSLSKPKKKQSLFGEEQGPDTPIIMWKAVSAIENGHKAPISQIQWIPAVSIKTKIYASYHCIL